MTEDMIKLAMIQTLIGTLPTAQKTEVANLVEELTAVIAKASNAQVASAAFALVSVIQLIEHQQTH
jgi:hypothetical protein